MTARGGLATGFLLLLSGLLAASAQDLAAQAAVGERAGGAERLTLQEAQERAARNNPAYRRTTNDLGLNQIEHREAWLSVLPRPTLSIFSTGMDWNLTTRAFDNFGNPIENPETEMVRSSSSTQRAQLAFTVDFQNFVRFRQTGIQAESREAGAQFELYGLEADVARAFLDAQERQVSLELEEELLESAVRNREVVERLYGLARRDRMDLLSAELDVVEQENQLDESRAQLRTALLELRNTIGDPELQEFEIEPVGLRDVDPARLDEEALVDRALESSPRIRQQQLAVRVAERDVGSERARWLPQVSMSLSTFRQEFERGGGGAFFQPTPNADWDRRISLQLDFPDVARHFDIQNSTRRARISVRNQEETLRQTRLEVEQEVRTLLVDLRSALRSSEIQERRSELAEEQLGLRLEAYRLGNVTFDQLQTATEQAAQARRQALQSRYAVERALVGLERALGAPLGSVLGAMPGPGGD